jgi:hypothetical protein
VSDQRNGAFHYPQAPDTEYQYIVRVKAFETLRNMLQREGIVIPETSDHVSFSSPKLFDMKGLKRGGVVWSYSIIRVRKVEEIFEED